MALTNLLHQLRVNDQNLRLRKEFLRVSNEEVDILRKYTPWAERIIADYVREFYDFQFSFSETRAFFERYARRKGISLTQLRAGLEQAQANYVLEIFREAQRGGEFGTDYFARRLRVGYTHNAIDLPMKWYLGSYGLHLDLLARYIRSSEEIPPEEGRLLFQALARVFLYDIQAAVDSFMVMLL
ncbi:MAG: protoglobin domain-containing protein, partial [Fimbriimonadales bacterium]|nr:protoglobin domain-containing protein [Fimbriimonadales bacterium]